MNELWGIDCTHQDPTKNPCVHDTVKGYRLHFRVRYDERPSDLEWQQIRGPGAILTDAEWQKIRGNFVRERNPVVFRSQQLDSAYGQMECLGGVPKLGSQEIHKHESLPPRAAARMLVLLETPLPKIALYFRGKPEAGDMLNDDNVFQCIFLPGANMAERRNAPERRLTTEELALIRRRVDVDNLFTRDSLLKCQHCHRELPMRTFSTITLRECFRGE